MKIKVISLNIRAEEPAPSSDEHEICHKSNLIICVNHNDSDGDGIDDLSDPSISGGDPDLAKIVLEKPCEEESYISGNIMLTFPANMNAYRNRDKGGGALSATYPVSLSSIPAFPGGLEIFLEGKAGSTDILDSVVKAEMTLDSGVKCRDEIRYTVLDVDLAINGILEADEETVGGLVVANGIAPRKEIILQALPSAWGGNVILTRSSAKVNVFTASTGGSQLLFNGTDNKFASSSLPKSLWVEGVFKSQSMRDVTLELGLENMPPVKDKVKFTVLWVIGPTMKMSSSETVSNDNDKKENYKYYTVALTYDLGVQEYDAPYDERMGWGTEAKALVSPSNFNYPGNDLKLDKDIEFKDWIGNGTTLLNDETFSASIPPGNDTDDPIARDDDPAPNGYIYDWDAPGLGIPSAPQNEIRRTRNNLKAFACITIDGTAVRCSPVTEYFVRFSMKQLDAPSGSNWVVIDPPDVTDDKEAGLGWTNLTWDLN